MNRLPLLSILGVLLASVTCIFAAILVEELSGRFHWDKFEDLSLLFIVVAGTICTIALLANRNWARGIVTVALVLVGCIFLYMMFSNMNSFRRGNLISWGLLLGIGGIFVFGILFVNNDKVIADTAKGRKKASGIDPTILDD